MFEARFFFPRVTAVDTHRQFQERRDSRTTRSLLTRAADHGLTRRGAGDLVEAR
jgi:hypothetical protein